MKRVISLLLIFAVLSGAAACRPRCADPSANGNTPVPTGPVAETPEAAATAVPTPGLTPAPTAELTDAPTEEPTPEPTQEPAPAHTHAPTAEPTDAPTAEPTPEPTPAVPTPTPDPNAKLTFRPSASLPLPNESEDIPSGQPFCFGGAVTCENPILSVTAVITPDGGSKRTYTVIFDAYEGRRSVELFDRTFPKSGDGSLSAKVRIGDLPAGSYTFELYASATGCPEELLASTRFKMTDSVWRSLISNNLRNSYAYALAFFGSRDEFLFEYKWQASTGRDIEIKGGKDAWAAKHMTYITNPSGGRWYVHKKAAAGFEAAVYYMKTTFVRVHGTNGDSGVIKLSDLIKTFDGTWNPRFVSDRSFVSHHAFGAAIDLNASMDANRNTLSNRELIRTEVGSCLAYNGIMTDENGTQYYDFTYSGSHSSKHLGVPTTVVNYLLYELAFYRAGFNWGYYYDHACDAMHFGLSEADPNIHNTSPRSLRKVYDYVQ